MTKYSRVYLTHCTFGLKGLFTIYLLTLVLCPLTKKFTNLLYTY